jgi:predicted transcriptional regulator of viral defense system
MSAVGADRIEPRELRDHLLAHGRPAVTLDDVSELLGVPKREASTALVRLRRAGEMFSPARGLYVAVPPQYRAWGAVPAVDFVDPMLRAGNYQYYVGLLSAAELHGAAHQRPQVFQVMVDRAVQARDFGRVRVRFYTSKRVAQVATELRNTSTGQVRVSTPAVTLLDLAFRPNDAGGLSNVATIAAELAEDNKVDVDAVVESAERFPLSSVRRLGWLLDRVRADVDTNRLHAWLVDSARASRPVVRLDPTGPRRGRSDERWGLVENADVEPDL